MSAEPQGQGKKQNKATWRKKDNLDRSCPRTWGKR